MELEIEVEVDVNWLCCNLLSNVVASLSEVGGAAGSVRVERTRKPKPRSRIFNFEAA